MAALPKRRHSTRRQGKRRAAIKSPTVHLITCKSCGGKKRSHIVCPHCGAYK